MRELNNNDSNMIHKALVGLPINICHIYIQLVKRFCNFVDLMLTSSNAIVRHFVTRAINSALSPIGRNTAVIRHRYAMGPTCIRCSIQFNSVYFQHRSTFRTYQCEPCTLYIDNVISVNQSCQVPLDVCWNYCAYLK